MNIFGARLHIFMVDYVPGQKLTNMVATSLNQSGLPVIRIMKYQHMFICMSSKLAGARITSIPFTSLMMRTSQEERGGSWPVAGVEVVWLLL